MKPRLVHAANGIGIKIPDFDPVVATHCNKASSYIDFLLGQINDEKIYAPLFAGRGGLVFLDLGANIGLVSLYASPACTKIVAVEPDPNTFLVLKSITLGTTVIEPVQAALAPKNGPCQFYMNDVNVTASSTVNTYGTETTVNGLHLMGILHQNQLEHVDVCKVDVEGAEGESLTYEELHAAAPAVDSYYIETHNCPKSTWETKMASLVYRLVRSGYSKIFITGATLWATKK